ncbi:MAG: NAD(P)/FAD-dependent oxidoreductase [Miltoncostaeaceae bacterium]
MLLAAGMDYTPPDLPGLEPLWGGAVFHCPFCHGWEVRERALAALGPGPRLAHMALLLTMWSDDVVALTGGGAGPGPEDLERLEAAGVRVDQRPVVGLEAEGERLTGVVFADGGALARDALMAATDMRVRSVPAERLGVATADSGYGPTGAITVDERQRTSVPGVFAAGDVTGALQQVSVAVAAGSTAGAMVVQSLLAEDHGLPG